MGLSRVLSYNPKIWPFSRSYPSSHHLDAASAPLILEGGGVPTADAENSAGNFFFLSFYRSSFSTVQNIYKNVHGVLRNLGTISPLPICQIHVWRVER